MAGLCLQVATTHFIAAAANFSVPRILSAHGFLGVALALLVPGARGRATLGEGRANPRPSPGPDSIPSPTLTRTLALTLILTLAL